MNEPSARPLLIVISAPSGAGKTTLCERLLDAVPNMTYSVSCTTRAPRGKEVDGTDYHFLSVEEFKGYIIEGRFLEYATVHGNFYGTLTQSVREALDQKKHVLLDIDVQGAAQIRAALADLGAEDPLKQGFVDIFIAPPSLDVLRARLERRGEDAQETIARRLANAREEMAQAGVYRYQVVNDEIETASAQLQAIIGKECGQNG